ncbi:MAG: hypothetical protein IJ652_05935 [Bacteroidales bacterium]|nr:hypothetical protein [Bacteroidales bacterium]
MDPYLKPVENLAGDAKAYADLKVDELKLTATKGLSVALNHLLSMILILFTFSVVLLALAFGCILLLGQWLDSYAAGAFIIAGVFLVVTGILYLLRKKLFINGFVQMFTGIFFENHDGAE